MPTNFGDVLKRFRKRYANIAFLKDVIFVLLILFFPLIVTFFVVGVDFTSIDRKLLLSLGKNVILTGSIACLLNAVFPFRNLKNKTIHCLIVPLIWTILYSYLFCCFKNYASYFYNYFGANMIFLLSYCVCCLFEFLDINKIVLKVGTFLYTVVLLVVAFPPIAYFVFFKQYRRPLDDYSFMSVLGTNFTEAKEYLITIFSSKELFLIGAGLCLLIFVLFFLINKSEAVKISKHRFSFPVVLLCILSTVGIFHHYHLRIFPFDRYHGLYRLDGGPMHIFSEFNNNIQKNAGSIHVIKKINFKEPHTFILVIGESANRDYMSSFNTKLGEDTTPWELKMRNSRNFVFFDNAYSNFSNTVMALSQALTNSNQYNNLDLSKAVTIVDIAKKMGYNTYWLSTQGRGSIWDAGVSVIAKQADNLKWLKGYDDVVINSLRSVNGSKNNFVIIHLSGSHHKYSKRYPKAISNTRLIEPTSADRDYKCSLLYTDEVLKRIFQYARKNLSLKAMVYFSDHGEDMKYCHVSDPFYYSMVRIPLWVYVSPDYIKKYPETVLHLRSHKTKVFTNDLLFELMHGLFQCDTNFYDSKFDLSNQEYSLTIDNAKTMRGEYKIIDDPMWDKNQISN